MQISTKQCKMTRNEKSLRFDANFTDFSQEDRRDLFYLRIEQISLVSHKTGKRILLAFCKKILEGDGDIAGWIFSGTLGEKETQVELLIAYR